MKFVKVEVLSIFSLPKVDSLGPHSGNHWSRPGWAPHVLILVKLCHTQAVPMHTQTTVQSFWILFSADSNATASLPPEKETLRLLSPSQKMRMAPSITKAMIVFTQLLFVFLFKNNVCMLLIKSAWVEDHGGLSHWFSSISNISY